MNAYLQITNLTKRYGATCALDAVSITVERGSTLALLGPNGAGKSTLFGCLLGLTTPTCGEIWLEGRRIPGSTEFCTHYSWDDFCKFRGGVQRCSTNTIAQPFFR
jgi:ABC-type multidrug transport system ATPase subunit